MGGWGGGQAEEPSLSSPPPPRGTVSRGLPRPSCTRSPPTTVATPHPSVSPPKTSSAQHNPRIALTPCPGPHCGRGIRSLEISATAETIEYLRDQVDSTTLVAGAALEGHQFEEGVHELSGANSPWNALSVWRVEKLAMTGFVAIGQGSLPGSSAGVEEVPAPAPEMPQKGGGLRGGPRGG